MTQGSGLTEWRAATAAIFYSTEDRQWMTPAQFSAWWSVGFPKGSHVRPKGPEAVGISNQNALKILRAQRPVRKIEALACAHFGLGFDLPIPIGNAESFRWWFAPRFGANSEPLNEWLDLPAGTVRDHLIGYKDHAGKRWERLPDVTLIRAIDWVWRCGPFCPFADRVPTSAFAGQITDESSQ